MTDLITAEEAIETALAMAGVQDGYAKKATEPGLKLIHKANAKAQHQVAAVITRLITGLEQARADAEAAVALALQEAAAQADPWDGPVTKNKTVDAQAIAAQQIKARIRRLAPASGVAKLEELRAERDEWKRLAVAGEITARHMNIVEAERAALSAAQPAGMAGKGE